MILSEQEIIKISNGTPNKEIAMHVACQSQHKADLDDFQKQKQEMWINLINLSGTNNGLTILGADIKDFKHKWGIE